MLSEPKLVVTNPLPPELSLTWELAGELSAADRGTSELAGIGRTLPNPYLLIRPFMQREAVLSSRIEGTQASLSDLYFFEAASVLVTAGILEELPGRKYGRIFRAREILEVVEVVAAGGNGFRFGVGDGRAMSLT